jgi:hypothetical protein
VPAHRVGRPRSEAGPGPFQNALDRVDRRVQHPGDLVGAEPEHVAQDEHGDLAGRQELQGRHEGQGDGLALLELGVRSRAELAARSSKASNDEAAGRTT